MTSQRLVRAIGERTGETNGGEDPEQLAPGRALARAGQLAGQRDRLQGMPGAEAIGEQMRANSKQLISTLAPQHHACPRCRRRAQERTRPEVPPAAQRYAPAPDRVL